MEMEYAARSRTSSISGPSPAGKVMNGTAETRRDGSRRSVAIASADRRGPQRASHRLGPWPGFLRRRRRQDPPAARGRERRPVLAIDLTHGSRRRAAVDVNPPTTLLTATGLDGSMPSRDPTSPTPAAFPPGCGSQHELVRDVARAGRSTRVPRLPHHAPGPVAEA